MKWWRTSLDLAPKRCSSSIKPFISIRSAANNQREVPASWREQEPLLKIYRISEQKPPSVAPHPNKCFVVLEPAGAWSSSIKLPAAPIHPSVAPVTPPHPLILIKHMALATYVGTTSPTTVFEPVLLDWGACIWNRRASGTLRLMVSTWWKGTMFVSLMT